MAKVVQELPPDILERLDINQWDMRTLDGNSRYQQLKASALPAIAIEDTLVYESIIPSQEALIETILHFEKNKAEGKCP